MSSQKILTNYMTNQVHTFGFCPPTPLQLYAGNPVHWDLILTDFKVHHLIKDSGKPNFWGLQNSI